MTINGMLEPAALLEKITETRIEQEEHDENGSSDQDRGQEGMGPGRLWRRRHVDGTARGEIHLGEHRVASAGCGVGCSVGAAFVEAVLSAVRARASSVWVAEPT